MNISKMFDDMIRYLSEAFMRIFSPNHEEIPKIGVQPFDCNLYSKNSKVEV